MDRQLTKAKAITISTTTTKKQATMSAMMNKHKQLATFLDYLPVKAPPRSEGSGMEGNARVNPVKNPSSKRDEYSKPAHGETPCREGSTSIDSSGSNNGDSGYSSEISDTSEGGAFGDSSIESDEFEDLHERIEFIRAKQEILGKANDFLFDQEELLIAAKASLKQQTSDDPGGGRGYNSTSSLSSMDSTPAIWSEARGVLKNMNYASGAVAHKPSVSSAKHGSGRKRDSISNPRDPSIQLLGVQRMAASKFESGENMRIDHHRSYSDACSSLSSRSLKAAPVLSSPVSFSTQAGHWMAQALIRSSSVVSSGSQSNAHHLIGKRRRVRPSTHVCSDSSTENESNDWKVIPSSAEQPLRLLVPPPGRSFDHEAIDMSHATAPQTSVARLVTQATPPFLVVYANSAFLQLAENRTADQAQDDKNHHVEHLHLNSTIIGQPVESLIQVIQGLQEGIANHKEANTAEDLDGPSFDSILVPNGKFCRIQVIPVLDRSSSDNKSPANSNKRARSRNSENSCCMSHLMVQIAPPETTKQSPTSSSSNQQQALVHPRAMRIVIDPSQGTSSEEDEQSSPEKQGVLGTVG